jgi:hypothetical protein
MKQIRTKWKVATKEEQTKKERISKNKLKIQK